MRINNKMTIGEAIVCLSDNDSDALGTFIDISAAAARIDPDAMSMGGDLDFACLQFADHLSLYGYKITALKEVCDQSFEKTAAMLRAHQLGLVTDQDIHGSVNAFLDGRKTDLDVDGIIRKVQNRIKGYKQIVPAEISLPPSQKKSSAPDIKFD